MAVANTRLAGKVAIVTGASSGIGKAIAIALAKEGSKVALAARRIDKLEELKKQINEFGGIAICVQTDVTKRDNVKNLVEKTLSELGPVDILINNAGLWYWSLMKNIREDLWDEQIDVNIKGLTNCIGAVLDGMVKRSSGHIINMSSENGMKGFPGLAIYTGTKFYVEGLSQTLRQEVCKLGVKVTCIQPGDVRVEDREKTHRDPDPESIALDTSQQIKNIMDPSHIADAVVYALTQPSCVAVNEILIQDTEFPL